MRLPPFGALLLALAVAVTGGWVLLDRAAYFLYAPTHLDAPTVALAPALPAGPQPRWAVDPTQIGGNLPPSGRSLFDFAMAKSVDGKPAYDIPYPFDALARRVSEQAGCSASSDCIRQVLIPLGRSLQRVTASPDFFAYPRVVIAVDGEGGNGLLLKDRLYIGYQEKSDVLEVISYNEAAGRFEFELVKDYRAGATPRVVYANRAVCTACHQNQAPLFSRNQWDETNANPAVAKRLAGAKQTFYGFPARRDIETPNAMDAAIHRANMIGVAQTLWRDGCGDEAQAAAACRRAALTAALQYRLSGERAFDDVSESVRTTLVGALTKSMATHWPDGMAIPNGEIPNRDPLTYREGAQGVAMTEVPARFEPLRVRAPLEVWSGDGELMARRLVAGLAQLFSEQDMKLLDARLAGASAAERTVAIPCTVMTVSTQVRFDCRSEDRVLNGHATVLGTRIDGGEVAELGLPGQRELRLLDVSSGRLDGKGHLLLEPSVQGRHARTPGGDAIVRIDLRWDAEGKGEASVVMKDDFAPVRAAIVAATGDSAFVAARPFARADVMTALGTALSWPAQPWCCTHADALPPAQENVDAGSNGDLPPVAEPFKKACVTCHRTPERTPPNFLHGDSQRVAQAIDSCAARIYVRLSMWDVAPGDRQKVPMPPPRAAHEGLTPDREYAPKPEVLDAIKADVAAILRKRSGAEPELRRMLENGYESLPACLPAGA